jgi:hypothetical protein
MDCYYDYRPIALTEQGKYSNQSCLGKKSRAQWIATATIDQLLLQKKKYSNQWIATGQLRLRSKGNIPIIVPRHKKLGAEWIATTTTGQLLLRGKGNIVFSIMLLLPHRGYR